jgi:hypothetical protein
MTTPSKKSRQAIFSSHKHTAANKRRTRPLTCESLETRQMMAADMPAIGSFDSIHSEYVALAAVPALVASDGAIENVRIGASNQAALRASSTLTSFGSGIFNYRVDDGHLKVNAVRSECQVVVQRFFSQDDGQWHLLIQGKDWFGRELQRRHVPESGIVKIDYRGTGGRDVFENNTFSVNTDKLPLRQSLPSEAWGKGGNDILVGGTRKDTFHGGAGADTFYGGAGTDRAFDYNPAEGDKIPLSDVERSSGIPLSASSSATFNLSVPQSDMSAATDSRSASENTSARPHHDKPRQDVNAKSIVVRSQGSDNNARGRAVDRAVDIIFAERPSALKLDREK